MIHIYSGILLSHKKQWNNGPRDYHTKWGKSERKRQMPYAMSYMWNIKHDTNKFIYQTETNTWT